MATDPCNNAQRDRPQLKAALDYLREGDTLAVWKLSRLARSLTQVIKTASDIAERGIALKVLTQNIDGFVAKFCPMGVTVLLC